MSDEKALWEREFQIMTFLSNAEKKLSLVGLLTLLQEVAQEHAFAMGHGYDAMIAHGLLWALTRQKVQMESWPLWGETIVIRSWVRSPSSLFIHRDFEIKRGEEIIGRATTTWCLIGQKDRRPALLTPFAEHFPILKDLSPFPLQTEKIEAQENLSLLSQATVCYGDLDVHQHMNNVRYASWGLDALPSSWHRESTIKSYSVNFFHELYDGDKVELQAIDQGKRLFFGGFQREQGRYPFMAVIEKN